MEDLIKQHLTKIMELNGILAENLPREVYSTASKLFEEIMDVQQRCFDMVVDTNMILSEANKTLAQTNKELSEKLMKH